jgi:hypothetical protein
MAMTAWAGHQLNLFVGEGTNVLASHQNETAKVAHPIITPINTPAMNPQ